MSRIFGPIVCRHPAVTALSNDTFDGAFASSNGVFWLTHPIVSEATNLAVPAVSPAVAGLATGGVEAAYAGSDDVDLGTGYQMSPVWRCRTWLGRQQSPHGTRGGSCRSLPAP